MRDVVRIAHSSHGAGFATITVGLEAGYYEEGGIDVQLVEAPGTSASLAKLEAGEADIAQTTGAPILTAAARGLDLLVVMSIEGHNVFTVMGREGVSGPDDLRGTVVGITGPRDQDSIIMRRSLRSWGIDPERDVDYAELGNRGTLWNALVAGDISAMAATPPQPVLARKRGMPVLVDYGETPSPYQLGAIVTSRRFADERTGLLERFLAAAVRGGRRFQSDEDIALRQLKARGKLDDEDALRETYRVFAAAVDHYAPTAEALEAVRVDYEATTGERLGIDTARIVDTSYLPHV